MPDKVLLFILSLFTGLHLNGQVPKLTVLNPPITIPVFVSGSFSELRNNHFHGGIDIRTNSVAGLPIVAPADGYASKITIEAGNYGKTLYIEHPDGLTTVYAHLQHFNKELDEYLKNEQYRLKSYEVELDIPKAKFSYKTGDTIAFSGNSGASRSPHLHFEVRQSQSNWVINPLLFGISPEDKIAPVVTGLRLYPIGEHSAIQIEYKGQKSNYTKNYFEPVSLRLYKSNGIYKLYGINMVKLTGKMGVAIECFDQMNGCGNVLDIYKAILKIDGNEVFIQERKMFSLDDTRYINAHWDYVQKLYHGRKFQRLFLLPNNKISFYENVKNNGLIEINKNDTADIEIGIYDFNSNGSIISFKACKAVIKQELFPKNTDTTYQKLFYYDKVNYYSTSNIELLFPEGSFYENLKFHYKQLPKKSRSFSEVHKIHHADIPLQYPFTIRIKVHNLPQRLQQKALIAENFGEGYRSIGGEYKNGWVEAKAKSFGNYTVVVDTVAPSVHPVNIANGSNLRYSKDIRISIGDYLSGIKNYNAWIDDKWVLMEYDQKKNLLTYFFEFEPTQTEHSFKIIVTDKKDNSKEINLKFFR